MALTSHPEFDAHTSGMHVARTFSRQIEGKYILLTGVSPSSIGSATALALASQSPALLILASRTPSHLDTVATTLRAEHPTTRLALIPLDLASQRSTRAASSRILKIAPRIDVIINNAAMMPRTRITSAEGIEAQFAANHLGGWLLANLLRARFPANVTGQGTRRVRIVNVSSESHWMVPVQFSDWNVQRDDAEVPREERGIGFAGFRLPGAVASVVDGYSGSKAYAQSKTAVVLSVVAWNKRWGEEVVAYALEPGSTLTNIMRDFGGQDTIRKTANMHSGALKNLDQGASTTLVAALDPALDEYRGRPYLSNCQFSQAAGWATNEGYAERLWNLSEELVGERFT